MANFSLAPSVWLGVFLLRLSRSHTRPSCCSWYQSCFIMIVLWDRTEYASWQGIHGDRLSIQSTHPAYIDWEINETDLLSITEGRSLISSWGAFDLIQVNYGGAFFFVPSETLGTSKKSWEQHGKLFP